MVSALEKLKETAKKAAETGRKCEVSDAKKRLEDAGKKVEKLREKLGDYNGVRKQALKELEDAKAELKRYSNYADEDAEKLIAEAEKEIQDTWQKAASQMEEADEEVRCARIALDMAIRRNDAVECLPDTPSQLIANLHSEVERGGLEFSHWTREQCNAMARVWIGEAKKLQAIPGLYDDEVRHIRLVFGKITGLTNEHRSGYIEALQTDYETDWDAYIEEAREDYANACIEKEKLEAQEAEKTKQKFEQLKQQARNQERAAEKFDELEELCDPGNLCDEEKDRIRKLVSDLLNLGVPTTDERLLDSVNQVSDLFSEGSDYRALRRAMTKVENSKSKADVLAETFPKAMKELKGKKAVIVGGQPREIRRSRIEKLFKLESLEWVECEHGLKRQILGLSNRVDSYDYIFEIVTLCGHHVDEIIGDACKNSNCRFIRLTSGYGVNQIASSIEQIL